MAGAASPSPQCHIGSAGKFQTCPQSRGDIAGKSPHHGCSAQRAPPLQGTIGKPLRMQVPWCLQGAFPLALHVDRTCPWKFHFSASLHLKAGTRFVVTDQVPLPHVHHF
ncbi:hypothetical protein MRX96_043851 [Rhipicephalus microplus]